MRNLQTYQSIWSSDPPDRVTPGGQFLLRTVVYFTNTGKLLGLKYFEAVEENVNHVGVVVQRNTGTTHRAALVACAFPHYQPGVTHTLGWQSKYFNNPLTVAANDYLDIEVWFTGGSYWKQSAPLAGGGRVTSGDIVVPTDGVTDPAGNLFNNCAIGTTLTFNPNTSLGGDLVGIDVIFLPD